VKREVGCVRDELLQRPVVEVEAEPDEATFACRHERPLARRVALEEHVPLEER
jgi:hypothetical protein